MSEIISHKNAFFDKKNTFLYKKRRFDLGIY
jgi:hypothetical protein